jgi:hypothetical protein
MSATKHKPPRSGVAAKEIADCEIRRLPAARERSGLRCGELQTYVPRKHCHPTAESFHDGCCKLAARRATRMPSQHIGRRVGVLANDEGHQRDGYAMIAGVAARPKPTGAGGRGRAGAGSSWASRRPRMAPMIGTNRERDQVCVMGSRRGTYVARSSWRHTVALESGPDDGVTAASGGSFATPTPAN